MKTAEHISTDFHELRVHRLDMAHPGDISSLASILDTGRARAEDIVAVIGKTEGNGGVNDFTRGYFTQSLFSLLGRHLDRPAQALQEEIPCILSGGTEGVLSPHYLVFERSAATADSAAGPALAIGRALSSPVPAHEIGRWAHVQSVAETVRTALLDARIENSTDVAFVQVKCPCVTSSRAQAAAAAGHTVLTADPNRSMAFARAAGAFGVALALGEIEDTAELESMMLNDFSTFSPRASISSGVEVSANEVVVLGHSAQWRGPLRMACEPMSDALDVGAVVKALAQLGLDASPQLSAADLARVAGVLVKCEPDRRGRIRGARHTMLDDTDINAQRHIRGALGGVVAAVLGNSQIFVSGGAEHQGPDGGGLVAIIASVA